MSEHIEDEEPKPEWIAPGEKPPKDDGGWWIFVIAGVAFILLMAALLVPNFVRARARGALTACKSNLKNIGTAMEMYSTDHSGKYPASMNQLTPNYLKTIPECPQNGANAYKMWVGANAPMNNDYEDYYYICCLKGHTKVSVSQGYPAYNGVLGLIERPPGP